MKFTFCLLFIISYLSGFQTVRNVRLVDHQSYIIKIIQKTVNRLEQLQWCNLKANDVTMDINENVLGVQYTGTLKYTNGFVISVQRMDINGNTVQQMWPANTEDGTTSAQVQATLRLFNVAVGYDVTASLEDGVHHSSGVIVYPSMEFQIFVVKNLYTNVMTTRVVGSVPNVNARMRMLPYNDVSKVAAPLFDAISIRNSAIEWGETVLAPIVLDLAQHEVEFPTICYNCAT